MLDVVIPCISRFGGTVDKFLGDGYLCLFDKPGDAIASARAIHAALRRLSASCGRLVRMGIGINFGVAMIGCLGTDERLDATVVGDAVNLAARLESVTKV